MSAEAKPKRPGFWDRVNNRLMPYIGPPPLGPYGEAPLPPTDAKACPLCGAPMATHSFERSEGHAPTRLICPTRADSHTPVE